jgi:hypothetical protein
LRRADLGPEYLAWCGDRGACRCGGSGSLPRPGGWSVYCPCPAGWARYQGDMAPVRASMAASAERAAARPSRPESPESSIRNPA